MTTWRASFGFGESQICVIASDDGAQTWKRVALIENVSEAALALLPDKQTVYLNARHTGQENVPKPWGRMTGYSTNEGINWSGPRVQQQPFPDRHRVPLPHFAAAAARRAAADGAADSWLP